MKTNIRLAKSKDQASILRVLNDVALTLQKEGIQQWDYP